MARCTTDTPERPAGTIPEHDPNNAHEVHEVSRIAG